MSINSMMKPYELQIKEVTVHDKANRPVYGFSKVADIQVNIGFLSMDKRSDDIRFKDCEYTGLTPYKDFNLTKEYRVIDPNGIAYLIKSINPHARLTQLLLQVVR